MEACANTSGSISSSSVCVTLVLFVIFLNYTSGVEVYYLRQGGYVIAWVCVCVRSFVRSLFVCSRCYFTACHKVAG